MDPETNDSVEPRMDTDEHGLRVQDVALRGSAGMGRGRMVWNARRIHQGLSFGPLFLNGGTGSVRSVYASDRTTRLPSVATGLLSSLHLGGEAVKSSSKDV